MNKLEFLCTEFVPILSAIDATQKPLFGIMSFHQMIEHMSFSVRNANGKLVYTNNQPAEIVAKMKTFMMSDKPFKDNTPNPLLPDTPLAPKYATVQESLKELQQELDDFVLSFKDNEMQTRTNPFFGDLNFDEWTHLLHKHALHHLRQFGFE
jgi:hypothetical protein